MKLEGKIKCHVTRCRVHIKWGIMCSPHYALIPAAVKRKLQTAREVFGFWHGDVIREAVEVVEAKERAPRTRSRTRSTQTEKLAA